MREEEEQITLRVEDEWGGLPEEQNPRQSESIDFTLVETLVGQLNAAYDITSEQGAGTEIALTFEKAEMKGSSSTNVFG